MKYINKILAAFLCSILNFSAFAQQNVKFDFRDSGKVFVVYAVIFIILAVMFIYLFYIDRKVKNLEDK